MTDYKMMRECSLLVGMGDFDDYGGWVLDTQFVDMMGVPYLLAHGLGTPVADAKTAVVFPEPGKYSVFVYTYNWVAPWKPEYAPGVFALSVGEKRLEQRFGDAGAAWGWHSGGTVEIEETETTLTLHDLTGYEGRCGLVFFTQAKNVELPTEAGELRRFFRILTDNEAYSEEADYDIIVAGAGIAGICCALSSARRGLRTLLIQDRGVVGGNNSSEGRVWLGGNTKFEPFPGVGNIVAELEQEKKGHYGCENVAELYEDDKKRRLLESEENLTLLLNHIMIEAETDGPRITAVNVFDITGCTFKHFTAKLFADCTGDGTLGYLAGADYEVTTNGHMGMTNHWHVKDTGEPQHFAPCPWAIDMTAAPFPGRTSVPVSYKRSGERALGCWYWESGMEHDPIVKAEYARDTNLRAMYGAWDCIKNHDGDYENYKLDECCHIGGKRESRRLFGDIVLTKSEVSKGVQFEDACVPSTWNFDVHYPDRRFYACFHEGDGFITKDYHERFNKPYFIPYRCLYSRNVENLFMAGRDVSVSHDALGTVRVMRTGGMMGEVIGYAAEICIRNNVGPRGVYENKTYLDEFIRTLKNIPG